MKLHIGDVFLAALSWVVLQSCTPQPSTATLKTYPAVNATEVSPDVQLQIHFSEKPTIGTQGKIRIFDAATDTLVDVLDMSIPAGPTVPRKNPEATYTPEPYEYVVTNATNANTKPGTPSGHALPTADSLQLTIIGGFTDAFHFYPIIVHDTVATIYVHHNLLKYHKTYYVMVDSTVLATPSKEFKGIYEQHSWQFTTRKQAPDLKKGKLVVDASGQGDFNTLQGALDFIPAQYQDTVEIFVKKGVYEELIYFRNKQNIIIKGEDKATTIIQYANNEVFNPHPWNIKTNEWPGTFPSRRAAFAIDHCKNIQLQNITIKTLLKGQAEGLLINGEEILVSNVHIVGDGDALQTNGTAYFEKVRIDGGGDMILGRGAAFFKDCDFYSPGPFMWVRNTKGNHGNVFVNCSFHGTHPNGSELARAPNNKGYTYPFAEAVLLHCQLENIVPQGWGPVGDATTNLHYWEYHSTDAMTGKPVDTKQRASYSKQLASEKDQKIIQQYSSPSVVLNGWQPSAQ